MVLALKTSLTVTFLPRMDVSDLCSRCRAFLDVGPFKLTVLALPARSVTSADCDTGFILPFLPLESLTHEQSRRLKAQVLQHKEQQLQRAKRAEAAYKRLVIEHAGS